MAVDASASTFWASKCNDVGGPVSSIADLGEDVHTHELEIDWAFPPKSFAVQVSLDGERFDGVFSTDSNAVPASFV